MGLRRFLKKLPERISATGGKAAKAMGWLGAGLRILGVLSPRARLRVEGTLEQKMMELVRVEQDHAKADFWALVEQAAITAEAGHVVTLTLDGVAHDFAPSAMYGLHFKRRWFDRFFKEPFQSLMRVLDADDDGDLDLLQFGDEEDLDELQT